MRTFLAAGLLGIATTSQAIGCETALPFHLRIDDCQLAAAVADGARRSPTLDNLIERIQRSNALVFVAPPPSIGPASKLLGGLYYDMSSTGSYRIFTIFLARTAGDAAIATFGHELRHAIELLESAGSKDDLEARAREGRTAWQSGPHTIETKAALDAGNAITRELKATRHKRGSSDDELGRRMPSSIRRP